MAQGKYAIAPDAPVTLGSSAGPVTGSRCTIDFTVRVNASPSVDSSPAQPGLQTEQKAAAAATNAGPTIEHLGLQAAGVGTTRTTVGSTGPALATVASGDIVLGTGALTDSATISGLVNPVPGATVEFRLYGPADSNCVQPSSRAPPGRSPWWARRGPPRPRRLRLSPRGRIDGARSTAATRTTSPVSGPCDAPNESVVVSPVPPDPGTGHLTGIVTDETPARPVGR